MRSADEYADLAEEEIVASHNSTDGPAERQRLADIAAVWATLAQVATLRPVSSVEEGRRLASQRDDLIARGVDPDDLERPL